MSHDFDEFVDKHPDEQRKLHWSFNAEISLASSKSETPKNPTTLKLLKIIQSFKHWDPLSSTDFWEKKEKKKNGDGDWTHQVAHPCSPTPQCHRMCHWRCQLVRDEDYATVITLSLEPERMGMFGRPSLCELTAELLPFRSPRLKFLNCDLDILVVVACTVSYDSDKCGLPSTNSFSPSN